MILIRLVTLTDDKRGWRSDLSRKWRILQISEGVIHSGLRPLWITPPLICRILHILAQPHSIISNYYWFKILPRSWRFALMLFVFLLNKDNTISSPGFFGQRLNNLQRAALLTSLIQYDEDSFQIWWTEHLVIVNYACGFNQSETGKYFEWIIIWVVIEWGWVGYEEFLQIKEGRFFVVELQTFCRGQIGLKSVGPSSCRTLTDFLSRLTGWAI